MYATVEDLVTLFGEGEIIDLSDRDNDGELDRTVVETAIGYAASEVDSYLSSRYAVPLVDPVPPVVMLAVADIVRYRLTSGDVSEKSSILERYKSSIAWLREVAAGKVALPCAGAMPNTGGNFQIDAGERVWPCRA